jgi:hypothetical protein
MDRKLLAASGCVHRSGYRTPAEFASIHGIEPTLYPEYFRITKTNLVVVLPKYRDECEAEFANNRLNWQSLGIEDAV